MISSGVVSLGGMFSRGPSWEKAATTVSPQTSSARRMRQRQNTFIAIVYRNLIGKGCTPSLNEIGQKTAATLPSTPLRSVRPKGRVLQFCRLVGCLVG